MRACVYLQVNSEEHDNVAEKVAWNQDIPADILNKIKAGSVVPVESVTVWIDPLDATQEYTGVYVALKSFSNTMHCDSSITEGHLVLIHCTKLNSCSGFSSQIRIRELTHTVCTMLKKNTV